MCYAIAFINIAGNILNFKQQNTKRFNTKNKLFKITLMVVDKMQNNGF